MSVSWPWLFISLVFVAQDEEWPSGGGVGGYALFGVYGTILNWLLSANKLKIASLSQHHKCYVYSFFELAHRLPSPL
jgi:hypothetical protein